MTFQEIFNLEGQYHFSELEDGLCFHISDKGILSFQRYSRPLDNPKSFEEINIPLNKDIFQKYFVKINGIFELFPSAVRLECYEYDIQKLFGKPTPEFDHTYLSVESAITNLCWVMTKVGVVTQSSINFTPNDGKNVKHIAKIIKLNK